MREVILFNSRDELLRMKVDKIVYFQADGNYTHIVAKNKLKSTLGASLTKTEEILTAQLGEKAKIFIVNLHYVYSINPIKQYLLLSDMEHFTYQLPVSKDALRKMKELMLLAKI